MRTACDKPKPRNISQKLYAISHVFETCLFAARGTCYLQKDGEAYFTILCRLSHENDKAGTQKPQRKGREYALTSICWHWLSFLV
jgi:hypothetical protein